MKTTLIESEKSPGRPCNVRIENVVATASLDQKIDLLAIMAAFQNVEYRPKKFPGLVFALKQPKTKTLIFTTGKMVCTGAKSAKMAGSAVRKVVRELSDNGITVLKKPEITVQNMVASADVGAKVDLEAAAYVLDNIMYEPEQFPGAIYRIKDPKTVVLIFNSGKLVITGAKSEEQVLEAAVKVRAVLVDNDLLF
ncbi:MAG: TATA-box-binding protein [Candidatus Bathyarchaeota archaeon]|nr:TATA-box-binding protein [Candidatus Bathyarchaeota archaeon]